MKHLLKFYIIILLSMGNLCAANNKETCSDLFTDAQVPVVENMRGLYDIQNPNDGTMVYVQGFRDKYDGGGGFFIFDAASTVDPIYLNGDIFKAGNGYDDTVHTVSNPNPNYPLAGKWDGMICKPIPTQSSQTPNPIGRWFRQWDSGKLNIRWFGGTPGNSFNVAICLNTALHYATLNLDEANIFGNQNFTNAGKTIFFPAGKYFLKSPIMEITKGVLIEGEGNMGLSDHSTHLIILEEVTIQGLDSISSNLSGIFRFTAKNSNNSGGGFKDIHISLEERLGDFTNLILLDARDEYDITKWKTQNVSFALKGYALRGVYMKGHETRRSIRNIMLMNSWYAGNIQSKESILAENVAHLQIIGGFLSSGRGISPINPDDSDDSDDSDEPDIPISDPGITLGGTLGCAYVHINDIDLTHGFIEIGDKSEHTYISCRFARLNIFNPSYASHINLNVSEQHYMNERILDPDENENPHRLKCPEPNSTNADYKCYNFTKEIQVEIDMNMNTNPNPNSSWN